MIFSIWPVFLTEVLGTPLLAVGFIDGIGDAFVSLSQAVSGALSDKIRRRKPFVWMGYLFGGIAKIGYALAPAWGWIVPFRILDRSGKMRGAPRDAMLAELSVDGNRGRHFGFLRTMDNAGAVVGVLLSMLLVEMIGIRSLLFVAAVPSFCAALLIIFNIRETAVVRAEVHAPSFSWRGPFAYLLLGSALFEIGSFSYSFLILVAREGGFRLSVLPAFYLLFTVIAGLASLPLGRLSDRIGRKPVLLASFMAWAFSAVLFLFPPTWWSLTAAFAVYGLHRGGIDTVQRAWATELAPAENRATALGAFHMTLGLIGFPASFLAGLLWQTSGIRAPFLFAIVTAIAATALLLRLHPNHSSLQNQ